MKKNMQRTLSIILILFVCFSLVVFLLPFEKTVVFWLSYVSVLISACVKGYAFYLGFAKGDSKHSKLYGFPVARIGTIYMAVQFLLSFIFICFSKYISYKICIIAVVALFAAALVGLITTDATREELERQDKKFQNEVYVIREMQSKVNTIIGLCDDEKAKKLIECFYEELRYSDPMSKDYLADIENDLISLVDEIQQSVIEKEYEVAEDLTKKATAVLTERNRLCKLNK